MLVINYLTILSVIVVICYINSTVILLFFRALINITKDDGGSLFITMTFIHQIVPLYFAQLMYADYVVILRIKWPCVLPKIVKIRAALLKLLAEMCGPV